MLQIVQCNQSAELTLVTTFQLSWVNYHCVNRNTYQSVCGVSGREKVKCSK